MRFYAITQSLQVIPDSTSTLNKVVNLFARENKISMSAQEARDFFYSTNGVVNLFESYDEALCEAVYRAAQHGYSYGEEVHPNRHKYYATPIFTVELSDNTKFDRWSTRELSCDSELLKRAAAENNIHNLQTRKIKNYTCEKKDVLALIAVDIPHPNFKKHHVDIETQAALHTHTKS